MGDGYWFKVGFEDDHDIIYFMDVGIFFRVVVQEFISEFCEKLWGSFCIVLQESSKVLQS